MVSEEQASKIRAAFQSGSLEVLSVSPEGDVGWKTVLQVVRNEVPWEDIVSLSTAEGSTVFTFGHRVFVSPSEKAEAGTLRPGDAVLSVKGGRPFYLSVVKVEPLPTRRFMYDLTAADHHNFVALGAGAVVSNSPDRHYHFRPPESEGNIGAYNRVFGQIWEDAELHEYLLRGLDWWNMMPPNTSGLNTLDALVTQKPEWRTAVLWEAITHACFALATNWTAEEFSVTPETRITVYLPDGKPVSMTIVELYELSQEAKGE